MPAVDTGFYFLFTLIVGALTISNYVQSRSNMKTPYQDYFGLVYLIGLVFLFIAGWKAFFR